MVLQRHTERSPQATKESWPLPILYPWRTLDELFRDGWGRRMVAIDEFSEDGTLVVRAELPGIDPDKDVEITIADGMLHISAERSEEQEKSGRRFHRHELRYGSFARSLPLPDGVDESKIVAEYKDGILEVRVPLPEDGKAEGARRVPVKRS
ncbi:MAG: Hsp20/alpha crystallin family protein [Actinomycetota bacterium]|jgi:HSP20 family protein|nr:Hsp20/alpha crystallin family protein [Actinomycetota bacterium]